jgi:hypothetical protein
MNMVKDDDYIYNFRLIRQKDGSEFIDDNLKTPISSLLPSKQIEYDFVENSLFALYLEQKKKEREQQEKENRLSYKILTFFNLLK